MDFKGAPNLIHYRWNSDPINLRFFFLKNRLKRLHEFESNIAGIAFVAGPLEQGITVCEILITE